MRFTDRWFPSNAGAAFVVVLFTAGCGFHPLYGTASLGSSLANQLSDIYVEPIQDYGVADTAYELRNYLVENLNANEPHARYKLKASLSETTQGLALLTDASITRYNDTLTVHYQLIDARNGKAVLSGDEVGLSAYNVVTSPYATLVAQQDADKRAAQDIAERLKIRLGVFFDRRTK